MRENFFLHGVFSNFKPSLLGIFDYFAIVNDYSYSRIVKPHDYTQSELNSVKRILKRETGHGQIYKQSICVILLVALIV